MRKIPFTSAVRYRTCGKVQKNEIFFSPYLTEEQAVSKWENGIADPSTSNLLALSNLYGVAADDLLKSVGSELKSEKGSGRKEENA